MIGWTVVCYLAVGGWLGLLAGWEVTLTRRNVVAPAVDMAVGAVVVVVAAGWPLWVVGWRLHRWSGRRRLSRPSWARAGELAAGCAFLAAVAIILAVGGPQ
jgi:hypothetical protein